MQFARVTGAHEPGVNGARAKSTLHPIRAATVAHPADFFRIRTALFCLRYPATVFLEPT